MSNQAHRHDQQHTKGEIAMNLFAGKMKDQLVERYKKEVTEACNVATMDGYRWYDTTDAGLEPQVQLLRQLGVIAHHPVAHTLIRFEERR